MQHTERTTKQTSERLATPVREIMLTDPGVTHRLVAPTAGAQPHGAVAALDLVDLVTHV
jgi:hypothetical protein